MQPALLSLSNWGGSLNRLCYGLLFMIGLSNVGVISLPLEKYSVSNLGDLQSLASFLFVIILALLVGSVLVVIGSLLAGKKYSTRSNIFRAKRVGESGNALLISELKNEMQKFEIASGAFGFLASLIAVIIASDLWFWLTGNEIWQDEIASEQARTNTEAIGLALLILLSGYLVKFSATSGLDAIDEVLVES